MWRARCSLPALIETKMQRSPHCPKILQRDPPAWNPEPFVGVMKDMRIARGLSRTAGLLLFGLALLMPSPARAGSFPYFGVSFGTPERAAAHAGVAFGGSIPAGGGELEIGGGSIVEFSFGEGAGQFSVGRSLVVLTEEKALRAVADVRATLAHTWDSPRGASPHATYAGIEGGLSVSLVRFTLGVSKRLEQKPIGSDVLVTWGIGVQIRLR